MRALILFLLAVVLEAQAPLGNVRLKFGVNSSQRVNRLWMGATGAAWAFADENLSEIAPMYGSLPNFTLIGGSALNCAAATGGTAKCGIDFNGSSDYVYISDDAGTSPTGTMTITTIAKIDTQADHTLISKWGGGSNAFSMFFGQGAASTAAECYLVQSDGSTTVVASGGTYTTGVWAVWTCVADGSTWRMYKNGLPAGSPQSYDGTIQDSTNPMVVGTLGQAVFFLDGKVAYADYRKTQLSASQVRQSYKALRSALCNAFPATGTGTFCTDLP